MAYNGINFYLCAGENIIYNSRHLEEIDTFTGDYTVSNFKELLLESGRIDNINTPLYIKITRGDKVSRTIPVLYKEDNYSNDEVFYAYKNYLYNNRQILRKLLYLITPSLKTGTFKSERDKKIKRMLDESFTDSKDYDLYFEIEKLLRGYLNTYLKVRDAYFFLKFQGVELSNNKGMKK